MDCFDTHTHSEGKGIHELRAMVEKGIKRVVSCAYYPVEPSGPSTLIDLFRKLTTFEMERGRKAGMVIYAAIGIHPRCIPPGYDKVLEYLEENPSTAFGEIGLETASSAEVEVLEKQLELAKKLDVPCIVHTPRKNKEVVTDKVLEVLQKVGMPEDLVVVDHANVKTAGKILKNGYWAGLTVQPGKLSKEEVKFIVDEYGSERFLLNSDTGFSDEELFAVSDTVEFLQQHFSRQDVEKLAFKNAEKFLRL
ncbi:TatD family hydrolase [Archaeoglobus veneficus]|uniref:TatD-related deoxyribonuclease n=1 Tax=Archaeoglobus veneficus (strain DSM 11195 / SNP6) TaxID=693661 RepID=F2KMV5_ARCVS|nr:TatD family hydrolase [Archaeoglobus veneficus]AEA46129.1 TatD-related deoxyribonuclease [Archaeoglobus veneficus SNP6]